MIWYYVQQVLIVLPVVMMMGAVSLGALKIAAWVARKLRRGIVFKIER